MLYILSLFGIGIESFLLCLFVVVRIQLQKVLSQGYKDCTWTLYVKTGSSIVCICISYVAPRRIRGQKRGRNRGRETAKLKM
ncbi:BnaC01g27470D [Brassica napus]|uniref:(rape) hypothetical protein n=1 Tax=Brassica napus TaxID=3708 RepID=A0A078H1Y7_BRANA|nr:unnamed protein product [Brassica napus]CDY31791.1 BnaC01g27470D [Brassica napus]